MFGPKIPSKIKVIIVIIVIIITLLHFISSSIEQHRYGYFPIEDVADEPDR